jgi:Mg2+ and Co2+ transporter CorA
MTPEQEQQMWEFVGEVRTGIKNIEENNKRVAILLEAHNGRLNDLEDYKNQMIGKVSIISIIMGAIGWGVATAIGWFINKY